MGGPGNRVFYIVFCFFVFFYDPLIKTLFTKHNFFPSSSTKFKKLALPPHKKFPNHFYLTGQILLGSFFGEQRLFGLEDCLAEMTKSVIPCSFLIFSLDLLLLFPYKDPILLLLPIFAISGDPLFCPVVVLNFLIVFVEHLLGLIGWLTWVK